MATPRGRITFSGRAIDIGKPVVAYGPATEPCAMVKGPFPAVVVYVRAASQRLKRMFRGFCVANALHPYLVHADADNDGQVDAFEVIGDMRSLTRLVNHASVVRWHYLLDVKPPRGGQGSGEITDRVAKSIRHYSRPKAERIAIEETQRRTKLPVDQQWDIELAEARQRAELVG